MLAIAHPWESASSYVSSQSLGAIVLRYIYVYVGVAGKRGGQTVLPSAACAFFVNRCTGALAQSRRKMPSQVGPDFKRYMDKKLAIKLNGNRHITGAPPDRPTAGKCCANARCASQARCAVSTSS